MQRVHSAKEYLQYWTRAMADVHWFRKRGLFDYTPDEMVEEIEGEFGKPGCIYLVAKSQDAEKILGVLEAKIRRNVGSFGRWEPAVPTEYRDSEAGEALIEEASSWLRRNRVATVTCMLRYPYSEPEAGQWHMNLYRKCGFTRKGFVGLMLLVDLKDVTTIK